MAVPATVDPTKPTIRVAEEVLPDGPAPDKRNPQKPKRKTQGGDVRAGLAQKIMDEMYQGAPPPRKPPIIAPGMPKVPFIDTSSPTDKMDRLKRHVRKSEYLDAKSKTKKPTQVAHFEPEGEVMDEASPTGYNKGERYTGKAGAMSPKEIERANEGSAERIRKTIKLANSHEPEGEMVEGAAWTKKSGKNPKGGLNEKGRKSYERENPGSDLKAPSKKVGNKRRASFCARMKGMKKKLTSAKTANDPDSRINKSLRAWNC